MSHFVGAVVCPSTLTLHDLLDRYDENREVPRYLEATKAQVIVRARKSIEDYRDDTYARYSADPAAYASGRNYADGHIAYLRDVFPLKLSWTDEEVYADAVKSAGDLLDVDGNLYSEYNPDSKWDWYAVGGRWDGVFGANRFDAVASARVAFQSHEWPPRVLVTPDGRWLEKGEMGWFGMSHGDMTDDRWGVDFYQALAQIEITHPSAAVVVVDFHI